MKPIGPGIPFFPQSPDALRMPPLTIPGQGITHTESINPPEPWSHGEGDGTIVPVLPDPGQGISAILAEASMLTQEPKTDADADLVVLAELDIEDTSRPEEEVPPSPSASAE